MDFLLLPLQLQSEAQVQTLTQLKQSTWLTHFLVTSYKL